MFRLLLRPSSRCHERKTINKEYFCILLWHPDDDDDDEDGNRSEQNMSVNSNIDIDIFVNCNWVDIRWQWYSTHLHTDNTQITQTYFIGVRMVVCYTSVIMKYRLSC